MNSFSFPNRSNIYKKKKKNRQAKKYDFPLLFLAHPRQQLPKCIEWKHDLIYKFWVSFEYQARMKEQATTHFQPHQINIFISTSWSRLTTVFVSKTFSTTFSRIFSEYSVNNQVSTNCKELCNKSINQVVYYIKTIIQARCQQANATINSEHISKNSMT